MANDKREAAWRMFWRGPEPGVDPETQWIGAQTKAAFFAGFAAERPEWVRCSDRLPDKDGWYAVMINDNDGFANLVEPYWFTKGKWTDGDNLTWDRPTANGQTVIAWMPLPDPFIPPFEEESE